MLKQTVSLLLRPRFLLVWFFISWVVFSSIVWFQNLHLIYFSLKVGTMSFLDWLLFLARLYQSLLTSFSTFGAVMTVLISLLFGLNMTLLIAYLRRVRKLSGRVELAGATSLSGLVSGLLGIGCTSCGSIVVTAILTQVGAAGLLLWLPLKGGELNILALGLLIYSLYVLIRKLQAPVVCLDPLP